MICDLCKAAGTLSIIRVDGSGIRTLMTVSRFYDSDGVYHHHDRNHTSIAYRCSNGHMRSESTANRCPADGCDFGSDATFSDWQATPKPEER